MAAQRGPWLVILPSGKTHKVLRLGERLLLLLVVQYIGELRAEVQEKYGITLEKHVTELAKLRDDARTKGAWAAAINAEVARGKVGGLYVDQKMILTKNLDNMSEKELESRLKQIIDDHKTFLDPNAEVIESESSSLSMPEESSSDPQN
jgi:hypothetical protein